MVRTPNNNSYRYAPVTAPISASDFPLWAENEFRNIKGALDIIASGSKEKLYVAPLKPRDGDFAYADGSSWNPGYGAGLYYYDGTSWLLVSPEYITGSWTPIVTAYSGTITSVTSISGQYTKIGREVFCTVTFTVTTNGTGAVILKLTYPPVGTASANACGSGVNANNGVGLVSQMATDGNIYVRTAAAGYPVTADGQTFIVSGTYSV